MATKREVLGSSQFRALRALHFSPFREVLREPLPPLHVVVDSTFALRSIEKRATMRNHAALTHFEEVVDAGVVVAYAPRDLVGEVDRNLQRDFVATGRVLPERAAIARDSVLSRVRWFRGAQSSTAASEALRRRNAHTDVRFCEVFEHLRLDAVLTHDHDWRDTGYPVLDADALDALGVLRTYARDAAPGLVVGSAGAMTTVAIGGVLSTLRRLPAPLLLLGVGALVAVGLSPGGRKKIGDAVSGFFDDPVIADGIQYVAGAQARLPDSESRARGLLRIKRRVPAAIHALRAVVAGAADEGAVRTAMIVNGWRPRTADVAAAVRRALRANPELERVGGMWNVRPNFLR